MDSAPKSMQDWVHEMFTPDTYARLFDWAFVVTEDLDFVLYPFDPEGIHN